MRHAAATEVQWHARAHINDGASHYIVGRDPAALGHPTAGRDLYDTDHGKMVLTMAHGSEKLNISALQGNSQLTTNLHTHMLFPY
jgi:3'-phosphoadenosine 5'-phosphosulfate synthase